MNKPHILPIAKVFWPYPAGRVDDDGPYNGEKFRNVHLLPALKAAEAEGAVLIVQLDGLKSCGSSFLETAFGGLVRYNGYTSKELQKLIRVEHASASLERYKVSIEEHIKRAVRE